MARELPPTIAAGQTTFRLVNDGQVVHHLTILRLARGKTMADVKEAMQTAASWPTWLIAVGGTNTAVPGDSLEATLTGSSFPSRSPPAITPSA